MYELFDEAASYTVPTGLTRTGKELIDSGDYFILSTGSGVVDVVGGIMRVATTLEDIKTQYGIDSDVPADILAEANSIRFSKAHKSSEETRNNAVLTKAASLVALSFTDEQAIQVPDLYPKYEVDHAYKKDERFTYNGHLFKVNQDHTSAAQWVPGETGTESLYTNLEMAGDGYLVWTQPTGAHNAYNIGDIVHYPTESDQLYKSLIDGNVWSPDAYPQGWETYTEE